MRSRYHGIHSAPPSGKIVDSSGRESLPQRRNGSRPAGAKRRKRSATTSVRRATVAPANAHVAIGRIRPSELKPSRTCVVQHGGGTVTHQPTATFTRRISQTAVPGSRKGNDAALSGAPRRCVRHETLALFVMFTYSIQTYRIFYPDSGSENCESVAPSTPFSQIPPQAAPRPRPIIRARFAPSSQRGTIRFCSAACATPCGFADGRPERRAKRTAADKTASTP